jgi:hypothetical protein
LKSSEAPGLSNSHEKGAEAFYSQRISRRHYLGTRYQFQRLLATPIDALTETHSVIAFYTIYLQPTMSVSLFAGPQYSDSHGGGFVQTKNWSPSYGGSFGWQAQRLSFALSAERAVSAGGGLQGAVRSENASASVRGQLTKTWAASLGGYYGNNILLSQQPGAINGGHSLAGTVTLNRQLGQSLRLELGYTRLHQTYQNLSTLSASPNANRVWLSLSYQMTRPIGR